MPKRERDPFETADGAGQAKHRPDQPASSSTPEPDEAKPAKKQTKRDNQDQLNVLIDKGNAKRFRLKAWAEDTTMSDLVNEWVREYLAGRR